MTPAAATPSHPERPDAFISYSRQDGEFVRALVRALEARGKDVWVDLDDIPKTAVWRSWIDHGIETSKAVVVVLSPSLAASQICGEEIRHAIEHNKRLIPILRTDVEPEQLFPELNAPNWILARNEDDAEAAFEELVQALETDLAWLEVHARLVARSVEWDREERDGSFLLRGDDLKTAQRWLAARAEHHEQPTELQVAYIRASKRGARVRGAAMAVAALGVLALAGFLLVQRDRAGDEEEKARQQERLAESRRLSADSIAQLETNSRQALRTAVKAHSAAPTPEAAQALRQALMRPQREASWSVGRSAIWSARFVDADTVRARTEDGRILSWSLDGGEPVLLRRGPPPKGFVDSPPSRAANLSVRPGFDSIRVVTSGKGTVAVLDELGSGGDGISVTAMLSPDGRRVLTAGYRAAADVWRVPARVIRPPGGGHFLCAAAAQEYTVTCDDRGRVAIWPSDGSNVRRTAFDEPGDRFYDAGDLDLGVSADSTRVFVTSQREAMVTVIAAATGEVKRIHDSPTYIPPVLSGDGRRLYVPSEPKPVVKDANSGEVIARLPFRIGDLFGPVAFDSTGERMATYQGDGVRVRPIPGGSEMSPLPRPDEQLDTYAFSPSGRYVATAEARTVSVYESDASEVVSYPVSERPGQIEFSRDDEFIMTAGNNAARVSEVKTGRAVAKFDGHRGGLLSASLDPGARTVVTLGVDGLALVHDCPACAGPAVLVKRARAALEDRP
ncbi:MAG: TIR domain-containing protein [Actinomycetota bacterium]|nr:TIR domain-containing protein [Actinomycetota bacterium]